MAAQTTARSVARRGSTWVAVAGHSISMLAGKRWSMVELWRGCACVFLSDDTIEAPIYAELPDHDGRLVAQHKALG